MSTQALVHAADISNAVRPPARAGMWTRAVYSEFFKQGDAERELGLDVSPLCDRESVALAESQARAAHDTRGDRGQSALQHLSCSQTLTPWGQRWEMRTG